MPTTLVWFRQDLRVDDNPALADAARRGAVVPVYILDDATPGDWAIGGAGRWWLQESLAVLDDRLTAMGAPLTVLGGPPEAALEALAAATGADGLVWNRCYEPFAIARDAAIKAAFEARGFAVWSCNGALLFEPWTIATKNGDAYKVYTPFSKACLNAPRPRRPLETPRRLHAPKVPSTRFEVSRQWCPATADWVRGLETSWRPGLSFAIKDLNSFIEDKVEEYGDSRDRPDRRGTSELSPRLHWGELSPHQVWHAAMAACGGEAALDPGRGSEVFLKELIWREFGYHILYHFPDLPEEPLNPRFRDFPWADDEAMRNAWRFARTGYPIVDAGMRQLRRTGWMHNRVRMIVGSFLVKDLLEHWRHGAAWFWDNLVDADLASNTLGWQWVGGCGPDAAPYFRVFNPVKQGERFDPEGAYVCRWVPELAELPLEHLHRPWTAPEATLRAAGVRLGESYPRPIVDHGAARQRALNAFARIKQAA
ncbi:MAG: cryptochrome/photolyase family protein [Alphaproteobacteria bacterium]